MRLSKEGAEFTAWIGIPIALIVWMTTKIFGLIPWALYLSFALKKDTPKKETNIKMAVSGLVISVVVTAISFAIYAS